MRRKEWLKRKCQMRRLRRCHGQRHLRHLKLEKAQRRAHRTKGEKKVLIGTDTTQGSSTRKVWVPKTVWEKLGLVKEPT